MELSGSPPYNGGVQESASTEAGGGAKGSEPTATLVAAVLVEHVPIDLIELPARPTRRFLGDVASLAESMRDFGLQQPISVRAEGERYLLTSGLRRLNAARLLGWQTIPAFVRNVGADDAYVLDLIENLQREDLLPEEEADALGELIRTRGWTLQQVAATIKRSVGYVSKRVRVFENPLLREAISRRGLPVSTAEELLAAEEGHRAQLVERALAERWDQVRARDVLHGLLSDDDGAAPERRAPRAQQLLATQTKSKRAELASARPRGFTRAVREFHRMINELEPHHLTQADRAALRALFRDLLMLARAPATPTPPVFPPLPEARRRRS